MKFISESLSDILKPKPNEEVERAFEKLPSKQYQFNKSVEKGYLPKFLELVDDPTIDINNQYFLEYCIQYGYDKILDILLEKITNYDYDYLVSIADYHNANDKIMQILTKHKPIINEAIGDILKPKSEEQINDLLKDTAKGKLLKIAIDKKIPSAALDALKKGAKINNDFERYSVKRLLNLNDEEILQYMSEPLKMKRGFTSNASPNQRMSIGIQKEDAAIIKDAIKSGATNTTISNHEAFLIATTNNDVELIKLLLKDNKNDPSEGGARNMRYGDYDNGAIRIASRDGFTEIVKLLLKDKRVNPSTGKNYPIRNAFKNRHWEIVALLLNDDRVFYSLDSKTLKKYFNELTSLIIK